MVEFKFHLGGRARRSAPQAQLWLRLNCVLSKWGVFLEAAAALMLRGMPVEVMPHLSGSKDLI
jgi:hypothetical protein